MKWNEEQILAISCLKAILINKDKNEKSIAPELLLTFKIIALQILSKLPYEDVNKLYLNNVSNNLNSIMKLKL